MKIRYILLAIAALLLLSFLIFASLFHEEQLDLKIFKKDDITLKYYHVSGISTGHDFIDLERNGQSENIYEANKDGIYDILLKKDTVIIQTHQAVIYEFTPKILNTNIILDSSITTYQYMKKFQPENAKYYK